jgi:hypothetical protein
MNNAGVKHNVDRNVEEGLNAGGLAEDSWDGLGLADAALSFTQMGMEKKRHRHGRHGPNGKIELSVKNSKIISRKV